VRFDAPWRGASRWFHRDPDRAVLMRPSAILSPADGVVLAVAADTGEWAVRVSIFLSLLDVHVQRAPIAGRVTRSTDEPGARWPAFFPTARDNAGHWLRIEGPRGAVLVHRVGGLLARRVTTAIAAGEPVAQGQRIGRIELGSRTDLYLPPTAGPRTRRGAVVRAGVTTVAEWRYAPP
jgi:phosphatidylserine decarboxylase